MNALIEKFSRRKDPHENILNTNLKRCLNTMDIAFLGIGNMLGSGIYVVSPQVAHQLTGPAIVLSYLVAGITSLFAALAYAEFGVRFPRCGSAYSYTYYSLGELLAFFVGWNVIMESVLSLAAIGRSCSEYADSLVGGVIGNFTISVFGTLEPRDDMFIGHYPNVLAAIILLSFVAFMTLGAKETSWLNNALVVLNMSVIGIILGVGAMYADISNWEYDEKRGDPKPPGFINGFLPHGWQGVFAASAQCFFAYVGFDGIAAAGEEAKDPKKSIPAATMICMLIVSAVYMSVSAALTLMVPYYDIKLSSGIPDALGYHGVAWAKTVVSIGAMICMATAILGTIYGVSRVIYAMAEDGLLPAVLQRTFRQVPFISMSICAVTGAVIGVFFNVSAIIEMLSIGTLFAYLIVAFAILVIRHSSEIDLDDDIMKGRSIHLKPWASGLAFLYPNIHQKSLVISVLSIATTASFACGFAINHPEGRTEVIAVGGGFALIVLLCVLYLTPLTELIGGDKYRMPFAPLLPILSIFCNAFLMTTLQSPAWERLLGWMLLGMLLYLLHGTKHSKLNETKLDAEIDHSSME